MAEKAWLPLSTGVPTPGKTIVRHGPILGGLLDSHNEV